MYFAMVQSRRAAWRFGSVTAAGTFARSAWKAFTTASAVLSPTDDDMVSYMQNPKWIRIGYLNVEKLGSPNLRHTFITCCIA